MADEADERPRITLELARAVQLVDDGMSDHEAARSMQTTVEAVRELLNLARELGGLRGRAANWQLLAQQMDDTTEDGARKLIEARVRGGYWTPTDDDGADATGAAQDGPGTANGLPAVSAAAAAQDAPAALGELPLSPAAAELARELVAVAAATDEAQPVPWDPRVPTVLRGYESGRTAAEIARDMRVSIGTANRLWHLAIRAGVASGSLKLHKPIRVDWRAADAWRTGKVPAPDIQCMATPDIHRAAVDIQTAPAEPVSAAPQQFTAAQVEVLKRMADSELRRSDSRRTGGTKVAFSSRLDPGLLGGLQAYAAERGVPLTAALEAAIDALLSAPGGQAVS